VEGSDMLLSKLKTHIESSGYDIIDENYINDVCGGYFDTSYCEAISTLPSDGSDTNKVSYVTKNGLYDKKRNSTVAYAQCVVTI
jgi:molecular chaperone GrpE (heat shock protein)